MRERWIGKVIVIVIGVKSERMCDIDKRKKNELKSKEKGHLIYSYEFIGR